jgi:hypothetical protein
MRNQLRTWAPLTLYVDHVVCSPTIIVVRLLDKHVHLTELELVTLAFAALKFVTGGTNLLMLFADSISHFHQPGSLYNLAFGMDKQIDPSG